MSSMRNAVQRRQHRERGQLEGREKWGILEKHKVGSYSCLKYTVILGAGKKLNVVLGLLAPCKRLQC